MNRLVIPIIFFITLFLILIFNSCEKGIIGIQDVYSDLDKIPTQKTLHISTYEGSCQPIHPDVVYFEEGYRGHYYYMSFTPYPFGQSKCENPCIVVSNNGVDFYEEKPGINPLVTFPANGYNDDPDLIYNQEKELFHLYYLETMRPDSQNVVIMTSNNGLKWKRAALIHYDLKNADPFILSPACIMTGSDFLLFFVNSSAPNKPVQYLKSEDGIEWHPNDIHTIDYTLPPNLKPWHIDIFSDGNIFYLLVCGPHPNTDLYIAMSRDLKNWTFYPEPILDHRATFFGPCDRVYRSCGVARNDLLIVWFSFRRLDGSWGIGVKKFTLSTLFIEE